MNQEIVEKLNALIKEIRNWPEIKEIISLDNTINKEYHQLIKEFNLKKVEFADVFQYGKHHPDYLQTVKSFGEVKQNLYNKEEVKRYFFLTNEVRTKLQDIIDIIANTISPIGFREGGNVCVTK